MARGNGKLRTGWVISGLASLLFLFSATLKLKGGPELAKGLGHLGLPDSMIVPLSILEISCVVIYLIPATSVLGAILLTGYLGGAVATGGGEMVSAAPRKSPAIESPATLPPPTTMPPSTVASTTPPGVSAEPATTLPPGPAERPTGVVAGLFWDALTTKGGVDPGVARCAADQLTNTTPEGQLLAMGIASTPRPTEVEALLLSAGTSCGITEAQLVAAGE